ncbi:MAG: hypothetical protein HDT24_08355 [Ruminococcus sp.]|nr:hypothetical protein [Ruminococcus sp.]
MLTNGAVTVTVLSVLILTAGIVLNVKFPRYYDMSVVLLTVGSVSIITFTPLMWVFRYMFTRDTLEDQLERLNNPSVEFYRAQKQPKMRFNFKEEAIREAFGKIAEKYKMTVYIDVQNYEIIPFGNDCLPKKGYNIRFYDKRSKFVTVDIIQDGITFFTHKTRTEEIFLFLDDFSRTNNIKVHDGDIFANEIFFDDLSDNEIFDIIEKMIYVFYNVTDMTVEKTEKDLYRKHYTAYDYVFYLDAPDYYGYSETTEIGNFKFILNKKNGGNQNG